MDDDAENQNHQHKLRLLEALKKASKDLQNKPFAMQSNTTNSAAIKALLELETQVDTVLSINPILLKLSQSLSTLKIQLKTLEHSQDYSLRSFIRRQITSHKISKTLSCIETEFQELIDQESMRNLVRVLRQCGDEDEKKVEALKQFENRVSMGFDRDLQETILRAKVFSVLESIVSDSMCSKRVREYSALAIAALVRFNKNVFVGQVLMGPTIQSLLSMASCVSIQVLSSLIKLIRSPLVYEMESTGDMPKIITLLSSKDEAIRVSAMDCVLEFAYFARKEAIQAMIEEGLIEKLVELQRLEFGSAVEMDRLDGGESRGSCGGIDKEMERELLERSPFGNCVTAFVAQLEMGEGLEQREKREMKKEILRRVREASVSEAEATNIVAEVLWGSSP